MDSQKLKTIIIAFVSVVVALWVGINAATAQLETVLWTVACSFAVICLLLRQRVWLLIPFFQAISLTLSVPGRPTTMMLAQSAVLVFLTGLFLMRRLNYRIRITELELWVIALTIMVAQVYFRNPVGVGLIGADTIGGKAYFIYLLALASAALLCGLRVKPSEINAAMKLSILGGLIHFALGAIGYKFAQFGVWIGHAKYIDTGFTSEIDTGQATRLNFLTVVPITIATWVSSRISPLIGCFHIRWAPLILASFALASACGYRNVVGAVGLTYIVGLIYRGRLLHTAISAVLGFTILAIIAVGNLVQPLPANIQRSLSFLPGTWDQRYINDAASSTNWRLEMWKEVLFTDRWINNKLLGDGLGFTARELRLRADIQAGKRNHQTGVSGFDLAREYILVNGDYHSGPVSAVRTVGYLGLIIMAIAQIRIAMHAHRLIKKSRTTQWHVVTLFFCIPMIWYPIFFWLVYGGFMKDGPMLLMQIALLRILQNNLPLDQKNEQLGSSGPGKLPTQPSTT